MPPDLDDCEHFSNAASYSTVTGNIPFHMHIAKAVSAVHFGSLLYLLDTLGELVDSFTRVIGMHICIFRSEVSPLKAVHGTKVTFLPVGKSKAGWSAEARK